MHRLFPAVAVLALLVACESSTAPLPDYVELPFDFNSGAQSWVAGFTDYPVGAESQMELASGMELLPSPLDTLRTGFLLSARNESDDVFMYLRRSISSLRPNTTYDIGFTVTFATNAPRDCIGIGGAPGEAVVVKAGASQAEPVPVVVDGDYRLSVNKGEQFEEGTAALVLGNVAGSSTDCANTRYEMKELDSGSRTVRATTDENGRLWLFVGVESGFEGSTRIIITRIIVSLERVSG